MGQLAWHERRPKPLFAVAPFLPRHGDMTWGLVSKVSCPFGLKILIDYLGEELVYGEAFPGIKL